MEKVPYHLGIIMDGNRRWAREKGLSIFEGHRQGAKRLKEIGLACKKRGIKVLTVYSLSAKNHQKRSKTELEELFKLFKRVLSGKNLKRLHREGIKVKVIGQKEKAPEDLQRTIKKAEELTRDNQEMVLNVTFSYGGRLEIVEAIRNIVRNRILADLIDKNLVSRYLWTAGLPDPDLIIRTSGEQRLSDFLTWQAAEAELYFYPKYWPDFKEKDLDKALADYAKRERRLGR